MTSVDELVQGPQGPERGPRRQLPARVWVVGGVVLVAVVVAVILRGASAGTPAPVAPSTASLPSATATTDTGPQTPQLVNVGDVCAPVTDGRRALTVSFTVVSYASTPVTIQDLRPSLPLGGLQTVGTTINAGTCHDPVADSEGRRLLPGGTAAVTFRFALPRECPAPYPVQAVFLVAVGDEVVTNSAAVLADLGGVAFATCPGG